MSSADIKTIAGSWSNEANAWVSETICLTGDAYLEATLPGKGRLVVKKAESLEGPWPKALTTHWTGPGFRIRLYGSTKGRYVRIYLTDTPVAIQLVNTSGHAV